MVLSSCFSHGLHSVLCMASSEGLGQGLAYRSSVVLCMAGFVFLNRIEV